MKVLVAFGGHRVLNQRRLLLLPPLKQQARAITVTGLVQGIGFRPFVCQLAQQLQLCGWVRNHAGSVEICVQGAIEQLFIFEQQLLTLKALILTD